MISGSPPSSTVYVSQTIDFVSFRLFRKEDPSVSIVNSRVSRTSVATRPILRPLRSETSRKFTWTEVPRTTALCGVAITYSILLGQMFSTDYRHGQSMLERGGRATSRPPHDIRG